MTIPEDKTLVFDADVLIHFMRAERFSDLRFFYPKNKKVILEKVVEELSVYKDSKVMLDSAINQLKFLEVAKFPLSPDMFKEFAHLTGAIMNMGKGESACMSYCKFTEDVVVSSNLRDVGRYCNLHSIPLISTLDLVQWAFEHDIWNELECDEFISTIILKGGRLPSKTIKEYIARKDT